MSQTDDASGVVDKWRRTSMVEIPALFSLPLLKEYRGLLTVMCRKQDCCFIFFLTEVASHGLLVKLILKELFAFFNQSSVGSEPTLTAPYSSPFRLMAR